MWLSVSDLASAKGVSKQAISKRLSAFAGRVPTRKDGVRLMVDVAAFDQITGAETDPAQALRNRDVNLNAGAGLPFAESAPVQKSAGARSQEAFSVFRAKREQHEAALAELVLEEKRGKLVRVQEVEDAMVRCAQNLLRVVEGIVSESDDPQVRVILKRKQQEWREAVYRKMKLMADGAEEQEDAT